MTTPDNFSELARRVAALEKLVKELAQKIRERQSKPPQPETDQRDRCESH